jgi:symplekin
MERAFSEEKARKAAVAATATEATKKRPLPAGPAVDQPADSKRLKVEVDNHAANSATFLAAFDFTTLPIALITDLIVANLQAFTEPALFNVVQTYRQSRGIPTVPPSQPPDSIATQPTSITEPEPPVKDEPIDPLKMDIDEEEMEYEPDRLNQAVGCFHLLFTVP